MFAELGAQIIDTDVIAREVVEPGTPALEDIRRRFGNEVLSDDGRLDRGALRQIVFSDTVARKDLEAILHPRIGDETRRRSQCAGGPYQLIVVPLLVESRLRDFVDRILVIDCEEETQLARLVSRDAETSEQARRILAAQSSRQQRLSIADDVISNDGRLDETRAAVIRLDKQYRRLAARRDLP